jgi:hypothetical protein
MNSRNDKSARIREASTVVLNTETMTSLRKRWIYLLPAVFVTYRVAYLDRANYCFATAAGLSTALHITDKQSLSSQRIILPGLLRISIT